MLVIGTLDEIMTKLELIKIVEKSLVTYYIDGMSQSINRNKHLNGGTGKSIVTNQTEVTILVDIINNVALFQGVDYAMTVRDFINEVDNAKMERNKTPGKIVKDKPDNIVDLKL
jgi:hypothetical protein